MHIIKFIIKSLCCLVLLEHYTIEASKHSKNDLSATSMAAESSISKMKKHDARSMIVKRQKSKKYSKLQMNNRMQPELKKKANPHLLNKKLLNKLGFIKVKAPNSHNRKRLAIESRRYKTSDDSHMFIIKLPPNFYYYTSPETATMENSKTIKPYNAQWSHNEMATLHTNEKKVFPFSGNGKLFGIYHWNLPIIKKLIEDKQYENKKQNQLPQESIAKDSINWTNHWNNAYIEKPFDSEYTLRQKSPSYYAPAIAVNKNSFNKYFSGNGKPNTFFVIKQNQRKKGDYKRNNPFDSFI